MTDLSAPSMEVARLFGRASHLGSSDAARDLLDRALVLFPQVPEIELRECYLPTLRLQLAGLVEDGSKEAADALDLLNDRAAGSAPLHETLATVLRHYAASQG